MASKILETKDNIVKVEVTADKKAVQEAYEKGAKKLAGKVNIPGFRKGKVPMNILEKHIGEGSIIQEVVDALLEEYYPQTIIELDLDPIDHPKIDIIAVGKDEDFVFTAEIAVVPEGKLGKYKGFALEKSLGEIEEGSVDSELEAMRTKSAKVEVVEEASIDGDTVMIDFEGFLGETPFEGGKGMNYPLELGSNTFIPGFEEQVVGMKAGEEKDIKVTFPAEYHNEELKGQEVTFKVKAYDVKRKFLSELNDEFAKEVSEFDTLEELKEDIRKGLRDQKEAQAKNSLRTQALDKGIEVIEVDVPEPMVVDRTNQFLKDIENDMSQQGMTLDKYYELTGMTEAKIREEYRENAVKHIKRDILLDAIVKEEGITVSDEDADKEIEAMAAMYGQPKEALEGYFKSSGQLKMLKRGLAREKALESIIENAKVKTIKEEAGEEKTAAKKPAAKKTTTAKKTTAKADGEKKPAAKKATAAKKPAAKKATTTKAAATKKTTASKAADKKEEK